MYVYQITNLINSKIYIGITHLEDEEKENGLVQIDEQNVVRQSKIDKVLDIVKQKYSEKYPKMKEKYSAHICNTADGIKL